MEILNLGEVVQELKSMTVGQYLGLLILVIIFNLTRGQAFSYVAGLCRKKTDETQRGG